MGWLLCEYLLKGLVVALTGFLAWTVRDAGTLAQSWFIVGGGLLLGLLAASWAQTRQGVSPRGRWPHFFLFLVLENPWEIYAGTTFGLAVAAILQNRGSDGSWRLGAALGGGIAIGLILAAIAALRDRRIRAAVAIVAAITAAAALISAMATWPPLDPTLAGTTLLLGLPIFALLAFIGVADETEAEPALIAAVMGAALWLVRLTPGVPLLALTAPAILLWLYLRHVQPGIRVAKLVLRGMTMASVGRTADALSFLRRASEIDAHSPLARSALAQIHRTLNPAEVAGQPEILQLVDPKVCLDQAAVLLLAERVSSAAITAARRMLDLVDQRSPERRATTAYWRAVAATHALDLDAAAAQLERLFDPSCWSADDPARAEALFAAWRLALVLHPELARRVGEPQLALPGRRLEAIAAAERELAAGDNDSAAWTLKRVLYSGLTLSEFLAGPVREFDAAYAHQLGLALIDDAPRRARGVEYLQIAAAGMPGQAPSIFRTIGETLERAGDEVGSRAAYERAVRAGVSFGPAALADADRAAYFASVRRLTDDARARNDLDAAAKYLHLATANERAGVETWRTLADVHERRGDALGATRAVEQALIFAPRDADLLARRDRCYYSLSPDAVRASESAGAGLDVGYCLAKARELLAHRDADADVLDWARHLADLATALRPDSIAAQVLLGQAELRLGERDRAVERLERVRDSRPERFAAAADEEAWFLSCRLLGDLYLRELDQPDRALACFLDYRRSDRSGADTLFKLGEACERLGDDARAARFYEQVTAYDGHPLAPDARAALSRLRVPRS